MLDWIHEAEVENGKHTEHSPVTSEGLAEVENTSLRCVVSRLKEGEKRALVGDTNEGRKMQTYLIERDVDNVSRDGGGSDEGSGSLSLKDGADSLGSEEDGVEVDVLDLAPFLNGKLVNTTGTSDTSLISTNQQSVERFYSRT